MPARVCPKLAHDRLIKRNLLSFRVFDGLFVSKVRTAFCCGAGSNFAYPEAYCTKFVEMILMVTADHGPAVSGAHNTIVTARAGTLRAMTKCLIVAEPTHLQSCQREVLHAAEVTRVGCIF